MEKITYEAALQKSISMIKTLQSFKFCRDHIDLLAQEMVVEVYNDCETCLIPTVKDQLCLVVAGKANVLTEENHYK